MDPVCVELAMLDALIWPIAWIVLLLRAPFATGLSGAVVVALALIVAGRRLYRAVWRNERYRFTTWRWGVPVATLLLAGLIIKMAMYLR